MRYSTMQVEAIEQLKYQQECRKAGVEPSESEIINRGRRLIEAQERHGYIAHPISWQYEHLHFN